LHAARTYLTVLILAFWFAATPAGANALLWPLRDPTPRVQDQRTAAGADAVVVLGGGAITANVGGRVAGSVNPDSLLRVLEGARVFGAIGAHLLIVSGGVPYPDRQQLPESAMLRDAALRAGVPASAIAEESTSRMTRDQALAVGAILRPRGAERFVLVTSVSHMRRALAVFRSAGLNPIASAAPLYSEQRPPPASLLPNEGSLAHSDQAIYEYAAWAYYWTHGWVAAPRQ
jgi:uncharacterized SAM-binding protein YcdF (DUF218 family)